MKTIKLAPSCVAVAGMAAVVLLTAETFAAVVTYTNRATWLAAVGPLSGTEDFNSFAVDASFQGAPVPLNNMSVVGTTGFNGAQTQKIDALPLEFANYYSWDGTAQLLADLNTTNQHLRVDFTVPVFSWGVDTVGMADIPRTTRIEIYNASNGLLGSIQANDTTGSGKHFYGFDLTADAASYLVVVNPTDLNDVFSFDNIGFVTVPEPAGAVALAIAAGVVGPLRRRRS
jgi:hypothetical protein